MPKVIQSDYNEWSIIDTKTHKVLAGEFSSAREANLALKSMAALG